jgi:hypothetical protein
MRHFISAFFVAGFLMFCSEAKACEHKLQNCVEFIGNHIVVTVRGVEFKFEYDREKIRDEKYVDELMINIMIELERIGVWRR